MNTLCNARFALTLILVMAFFSGFSQKAQHVPGEVLIQFSPGITAEAWLKRSPTIQNAGFYVKTGKRISAPLNIYSVQFDHQQIDEDLFLELVRQSPYVQIAQFNHYVELRSTIPNDPQYGQQWQYDNTGQGGGTPGADIDMDLAWDFTTGGLTASGDTIVVCVIDDGISATHPDIAPNLWINHAEIPNNGIDDDNNGFVDDYRGWDTGSGTDEVYDGGGHGTPVAGIVGAKGDNNEGVAGVNWNVKLMIVQGGTGVESEVLEAYSYPLVMRQKYNATNGQEGAFVVSTNASWGVDFGQASSAPLWCAFYDTLGAYGILNAGATANAALDVDVDGDLPTSCPSDYLISVTNMNRNDVKVNQAAWGLTHVDLGAFGEGTWTTAAVGYGGFGGTSGATPHVAGTIALLYSAPCPALISLAKSNPAAAALLVKQAILDGVDPNTSLNNITVTGGRLNVHNSMLLLLQNCGPCPAPFIQAETELTDVQARLNWTVNDSALTTDLQWRVLGDTVWNAVNGLDSTYLLTGLLPCTEYEYQLISNCPNDTSDTPASRTFKTDGCCENPNALVASDIQPTSALVSWESVLAAQAYQIRIRELGGSWSQTTLTDTIFMASGLENCTQYEVEISVICAADTVPFGKNTVFRTTDCGNCIDLPYCAPPMLDASEEWIDTVLIGTMVNASGSDNGYGDYTFSSMNLELMHGDTIGIRLTPGFGFFNFNEQFQVWIDYNQDGDFDDLDEVIYTSPVVSSAVSDDFIIPAHALVGPTRLRVAMQFDALPGPCDPIQGDPFGEVEDYCVTIVPRPVPCLPPSGMDTLSVSNTGLIIGWDTTNQADEYRLRYRELAASNWTMVSTTEDSVFLNNLANCQSYEMQVQSICMDDSSEFGQVDTFQTLCRTSLESRLPNNSLKAYPNPFSQQIEVEINLPQSQGQLQISIFDPLGQRLYHSQLAAGTQSLSINTAELPAGLYWLRLSDQNSKQISTPILKID